MEQPIPVDVRRDFGRYMSVWIPLFIGELDKAGLLDTVKNHLADSESEGGTQMRSCIEQVIAGAVDAYFNKVENQQIMAHRASVWVNHHNSFNMQVRIFSRRYSSSLKP